MKIISTILYSILVAVVIGVAGLVVGTMMPIVGDVEIKIVKSGSMEPAISTGSLVIVRPAQEYKKGDVITFGADTKADIPTTHRIIAVNADGTFTTKGDANEEEDQAPVARRDVIGVVAFSLPYAGYILDFARQPLGFALLIAIPAGLIILEELLTIGKEARAWWRRRNDKNGDEGGAHEDLGTHLRRVYAKRRAMDEIHVPMYVEVHSTRAALVRVLGLRKDAYGTSTALVMGLIFTSSLFSGHSGGTISYFSDIERSVGNIFRAGTWEPLPPLAPDPIAAFSLLFDGAVLGESIALPLEETDEPPAEASPTEALNVSTHEPPEPASIIEESTPPDAPASIASEYHVAPNDTQTREEGPADVPENVNEIMVEEDPVEPVRVPEPVEETPPVVE